MSGSRIAPVNGKVQGISEKLRPTEIKELRLFLGAVNQLNKFVADLASIYFPFRSILKKEIPWIWTEQHDAAFLKVNQQLKKITGMTHFKRDRPIRTICDASEKAYGAVLQQQQSYQDWEPVSFGSRCLTEFKSKYSISELELLAVVWASEHFKNDVYFKSFQRIKRCHRC